MSTQLRKEVKNNENKKIHAAQGVHNYYFAGDYTGCPSMETAVYSGCRVANALSKNKTIDERLNPHYNF